MKTYYLSEDSDNSPFVRLFNAVYGRDDVLIGVGRNAKLFNKAKYLSADGFSGDELLRVVCDVVDDFNNWASSVNGLVLGKRLS